jgi:hypothetical protein
MTSIYFPMKKFTIFLFLSFTITFSAIAENKNTFKVAETDISYGYFTKKVWLEQYAVPKVELTDIKYVNIGAIPTEAVPTDPSKFQVIIGKERKRPFALIRVPAFSLDPQTGLPRRIQDISAIVTEDPAAAIGATPAHQAKSTAVSSPLASGTWNKVAVGSTGFYKMDFNFLATLGLQAGTNSSYIRVFGNGGNMLPENNAIWRPDNLMENPIWVNDGGDGKMDQGDFVVFYATGPMAWAKDSANARFIHQINLYEDAAYYFVNFDPGPDGLRVQGQGALGTPTTMVNSFDYYDVYEKDLVNPGSLGKEWWGEEFSSDPGKVLTHTINMNYGSLSEDARFRIYLGARTDTGIPNFFTVNINGNTNNINVQSTGDGPVAHGLLAFTQGVSGSTDITITYQSPKSENKGFLSFIEVNARKPLNISGAQQLLFRDWRSVGAGNIAGYNIEGASGNIQVWDITDPLNPVKMSGNLNGNTFTFAQEASMLHQFAALNGTDLPTPTSVGKVDNQNLHGEGQVDYIIVTHSDFLAQANELADFHRQRSNLRVLVVTTTQVYNEFSSGGQDISAIRDFVKMFYDRAGNDTTQMPKYLLLFGDASYDYKNRLTVANTNKVPTFESVTFMPSIDSYCGDDFFSFLDDNENIENFATVFNTMDIGVGRFPVVRVEDAAAQIAKIKNYKSPASLGPWKLSVSLSADNADGAGDHDLDAELMGAKIADNSNIFNFTKVYLDVIPRISTPGGLRAPDANKAINDQIFKGTFLLNYSGHGNTQVLADERIIIQDDYSKWKNINKLPIIITATCDYGQFDHPEYVSSGEALMLKSDGGAVATLTTTALVYASGNRKINQQFLEDQFAYKNGKNYSLGDAFRLAKNETYAVSHSESDLINFRKFALLGDPALIPAFPEHNVVIDSLNDDATGQATDTIKALGAYKLSGRVIDDNGNLLNDFNGYVYLTIYDKPKTIQSITGINRKYKVQNNVIYKGKVSVAGGKFAAPFIAPKDINYDMGVCKISAYAENGATDGAGADTTFEVGGFSDNPVIEDNPPIVMPYIEDSLFKDGGITGPATMLYVVLKDETGINVSGNTVGHDLTAVLDDDAQNPYIMNDYYETEPNTYKKGYVFFPISGLSNGKHSLRVKAWDVNNNSGEGVVNFEVIDGEIVRINNLINYPNPFSTSTHFLFEHNHPDEPMDVSINIYSTSGTLVRTIRQNFTPSGSRSGEITWDGTSNDGALLPSGLYVYRLKLATASGSNETAYQKLVIIR